MYPRPRTANRTRAFYVAVSFRITNTNEFVQVMPFVQRCGRPVDGSLSVLNRLSVLYTASLATSVTRCGNAEMPVFDGSSDNEVDHGMCFLHRQQ